MVRVNLLAKLLGGKRTVFARATATATDPPLRDGGFKAALSLDTIDNFGRRHVSDGRAFVQVDSYRAPEQEEILSARMKQATEQAARQSSFDLELARARCKKYRRRILDMSQNVAALHIGGAFSCTEIVDCIYNELMRPGKPGGKSPDTFLMSKGHGCMIQYVVLEDLGVLSPADLDAYCTPGGRLGAHPDHGNPGIEASTGSLGHGLSMAVGMALAERGRGREGVIYTVISDGEVQEGSTWEAVLLASSLGLANMVAFVDNNDFQSLDRTSQTHPSFYPLPAKFDAFGWETVEIDGHDSSAVFQAVTGRTGDRPLMVVARTTKGKGTSFMENAPIWHYRSPNKEEYLKAIAELEHAT